MGSSITSSMSVPRSEVRRPKARRRRPRSKADGGLTGPLTAPRFFHDITPTARSRSASTRRTCRRVAAAASAHGRVGSVETRLGGLQPFPPLHAANAARAGHRGVARARAIAFSLSMLSPSTATSEASAAAKGRLETAAPLRTATAPVADSTPPPAKRLVAFAVRTLAVTTSAHQRVAEQGSTPTRRAARPRQSGRPC